MKTIGTISRGIKAPIIKKGDDLVNIVVDSVLAACEEGKFELQDRDVVAMTEAIVGRAQGNYATLEQIAKDVKKVNDKIEKFMVNRVGIDEKWLKKHRYEDYWLDKTEAIELGIDNSEEYDELN